MHQRYIWLLSIIVGGCIAISVLWAMSALVDVDSVTPQDLTEEQTLHLQRTPNQCNKIYTDSNQAIFNSRSCQTDDDCALVRDRTQLFGKCFISVQSEKADLVSAALKEFWTCRGSGVFHCDRLAGIATCQENTCAVEYLSWISLEELSEQTMESIAENLLTEDEKVGN